MNHGARGRPVALFIIKCMITFGYNNKVSSILRALCAIAIGLVMVFNADATVKVVQIIAAFLFAAGVVSFGYGYANRKSGAMTLMTVNAVVDIVIGLLLFLFPHWVAGAIVFVIGVVILLLGIIQFFALYAASSLIGGGGSLIFSLIAIGGGVLLLFNPFSERVMSVLAGVFLIYYGVSELLSMRKVRKAKEEYDIKFPREDDTDSGHIGNDGIKDVEYHKVDEQ